MIILIESMSQYGGISYQFNFLKMRQNVSIKTEGKTVYINSLQIVKNAFISICTTQQQKFIDFDVSDN